jgi:hypothetical protein
MSRSGSFVNVLIGGGALLFVAIAHAQLPVIYPRQLLPLPPHSAPQPAEPVTFGEIAATDGKTILVTVSQGPAAYSYVRNASGKRWVYEGAVAPSNGTATNGGAVRGNVALVNGLVGSQGAVFVFLRLQGRWTQTQTIFTGGPVGGFNTVAIGPDYIAIGDITFDEERGGVHIYNEAGAGTYVFDSTLRPADAGSGFLLGLNPIAEGDSVLAFAPGAQVVCVFARSGGLWSEQAQLPSPFPQYGFSGDRAFLERLNGRPQEFVRHDGTWTAGQELLHPQDPDKVLFGPAMNGGRVVAREFTRVQGITATSAILFELDDLGWLATTELKQGSAAGCEGLSIAGTVVLSRCPRVRTGHPVFEGQVQVYEVPR